MTFRIRYFALILLFLTGYAFADDPFLSDNPETLAPHEQYLVFYSFYNQYRFGKTLQAPGIEFDFNVIPNMEVDTYTPMTSSYDGTSIFNLHRKEEFKRAPSATGLGDIDIELKYRFVQETKHLPQVAFGPNFYLPTGDYHRGLGNGRFYWSPAFSTQKTIGKWLLYAVAGYFFNGAPRLNNYLYGGFVAQNQLTDKFALGLEIFSQGRMGKFIGSSTLLDIGTQYEIEKKCTLFFSIGHSILGENQVLSYFGIGFGNG